MTLVQSNMSISQNHRCGILVKNLARPKIKNNRVFGNQKQGILLQESCSAFIIGNSVYRNIKANIALGGIKSGNNVSNFYNIILNQETITFDLNLIPK